MSGPAADTWADYGAGILARLSPKVVIPFVAGLIALAIHWIATGEFDDSEVLLAVSDFVWLVLGVAVPAALARDGARVNQSEVAALAAQKLGQRGTTLR